MADELEVRVTITRKASTEHGGADFEVASVASTMNDADRQRFLAFLVDTYGQPDEEGNVPTVNDVIKAYWSSITKGTVNNIERWEKESAAQAARDAVTPIDAQVV